MAVGVDYLFVGREVDIGVDYQIGNLHSSDMFRFGSVGSDQVSKKQSRTLLKTNSVVDEEMGSNTTNTPGDVSMEGSHSRGHDTDVGEKLWRNLQDISFSNRKKHGTDDADDRRRKLEKLQASINVPHDGSAECEACRYILILS